MDDFIDLNKEKNTGEIFWVPREFKGYVYVGDDGKPFLSESKIPNKTMLMEQDPEQEEQKLQQFKKILQEHRNTKNKNKKA